MKENNPIVSLILPVYNRENTIIPCVESILNSEFSKFEILLIEDGSIDSTREKCEKLVTKDNRVRLFCKKNEGVSVARNIGLFYGRGEWVTFVDSDDVILPCHLNVLNTLYDDSIDLIMTDYASGTIVDSRIEPQGTIGSLQNAVIASTAAVYLFNDFLPFKNPVYPIWNKFFRKRIIQDNKIMFDTTSSLGEDQIFLCHYLQYAKGIVHYRIKSYVNVSWSNLVHLGSKLRTPSDYLHNQKLNYEALSRIISIGGKGAKRYAVNYGIDRPITQILYNYTKRRNRKLLSQKELEQFTETEIIPYIKSIDTGRYKPVNMNVRIVYFLLL